MALVTGHVMNSPHEAKEGRGLLVIVSGPSGSGKTTIVERLSQRMDFERSISATTRPKRPDEKEGRDYCFLSREEFEKKMKQGHFLEHARVFGQYYGTPAEPVARVLEDGGVVLLEIDVQGAAQVMKKYPHALSIFIQPPEDEKTLRERLKVRSTETDTEIAERIAVARKELAYRDAYQHVVVNDDLTRAVEEVQALIERAQKGT
jgi:guanylate kinase